MGEPLDVKSFGMWEVEDAMLIHKKLHVEMEQTTMFAGFFLNVTLRCPNFSTSYTKVQVCGTIFTTTKFSEILRCQMVLYMNADTLVVKLILALNNFYRKRGQNLIRVFLKV